MDRVLITGGSRGIGAACVRKFTDLGYDVYFSYKSSTAAAKKLSEQTGAAAIMADAANADDIRHAAEKIGGVDVIVNNAGISQIKMFQDITEYDWDRMFDVNIKGMFLTTQAFMQHMLHNKFGRIINISSMWGETGGSCEVHYSAAKAAVIGFTKALAKELAPSGITVNCVSPGVIATDMNKHLCNEDIAELEEETPVGRIGQPEEVADVVAMLAARSSGFITGSIIPINGGIVI